VVITITKKTPWGSLRYFTLYKNGVKQGKLFTNVPVAIDVNVGDVLTFHEGWLQLPRRVEVLPDTKAITVVNTKKLQRVFEIYLMLFLLLSLSFLSIQTISRFILAEIIAYLVVQWIFNQQRYRFILKKQRRAPSYP